MPKWNPVLHAHNSEGRGVWGLSSVHSPPHIVGGDGTSTPVNHLLLLTSITDHYSLIVNLVYEAVPYSTSFKAHNSHSVGYCTSPLILQFRVLEFTLKLLPLKLLDDHAHVALLQFASAETEPSFFQHGTFSLLLWSGINNSLLKVSL